MEAEGTTFLSRVTANRIRLYAPLTLDWRATGARGERFAAARLFLTTLTALELNY